jgi:hypothetical protein
VGAPRIYVIAAVVFGVASGGDTPIASNPLIAKIGARGTDDIDAGHMPHSRRMAMIAIDTLGLDCRSFMAVTSEPSGS